MSDKIEQNVEQPATAVTSGDLLDEIEPRMMVCPSCHGSGEWETECCNGSGGCSCRGQVVLMGRCNVCSGHGEVPESISEEQRMANCRAIEGLCFIGSGPSTGIWAGEGARGHFV